MTSIVIIGGGFCGMMTALHLSRQIEHECEIKIINTTNPFSLGVAYNTYSQQHLLNVMAGKMSAFENIPEHFTNWLKTQKEYSNIDTDTLNKTFIPRSVYGTYLLEVWKKNELNLPDHISIEIIPECAVDIDYSNDGKINVLLESNKTLNANYLVLATGNSEPDNIDIPNKAFFKSPSYFQNPWLKKSVINTESKEGILIIGNGLTMVDTVIGLIENKFSNTIYSISPHGFTILPHRSQGEPYKQLIEELNQPYNLLDILSKVNKHVKRVRKLGISAESIIDSLRSLTPIIWAAFSLKEKQIFYKKLRHLWGVARHRLPLNIHDRIQNYKLNKKLVVISGKIENIVEEGNKIQVFFYNKSTKKQETITVERVINCTGPALDLRKSSNILLKNLVTKGIITQDPLAIGVNINPKTFNVIDKNNIELYNVYTLGGNLRSAFWESTAVPELRKQAVTTANAIVSSIKAHSS